MRFAQVQERIHRLSAPFPGGGAVQLYLVRGARTALVDTGVASSPRNHIAPALRHLGLDLGDIDLVISTHGHFDHLGGNGAVKETSGADLLLHEADEHLARSADAHAALVREPFEALGIGELAGDRSAFVVEHLGTPVGIDRPLRDGDVVDLGAGVRLRVVHTPGHTPGSVCLYWEEEGVLFSGDAVQARGSRPGGLPVYGAPAEYRRSLERIEELDIRLLLLGHWFLWQEAVPSPERRGPEVAATLEESRRVSLLIEQAVGTALREARGAGQLEIAQAASAELLFSVPLLLDRETRLPLHGLQTLAAHVGAPAQSVRH